jgi:hypothetical protein
MTRTIFHKYFYIRLSTSPKSIQDDKDENETIYSMPTNGYWTMIPELVKVDWILGFG